MALTLRHMEVFRAVYTARSVSLGASALNVSQPSVSRMLRYMEDRLGYRLFRLQRGRIAPTPEADRLFQEIDKVFDRVEQAIATARAIGEGQNDTLAVVANHGFALAAIPRALSRVKAQFPAVGLSLNVQSYRLQLQTLSRGDATLGVAGNVTEEAGLERRLIGKGRFMAVLPSGHALAEKTEIALVDLAGGCILPPRTSPWGQAIYGAFQAQSLDPRIEILMHSPLLCDALVEAFQAPSIIDNLNIDRITASGAVVVRPLDIPLGYNITAFWSTLNPLSLAGLRLLEVMEEEFAALGAGLD